MSSRLASFRGPSTPTASPVKQPSAPSSPRQSTESTYHRKVRNILLEMRSATQTWDDLVTIDGLKAAKSLVDARTELDNALQLIPPDTFPRTPMVGPKVSIMERNLHELDAVIVKLRKQLRKMNTLVENMEETLFEAHKQKGWKWVQAEPLWCTWTLEKFATMLPNILRPYHRSLNMHAELVEELRDHYTTFEVSRKIISQWIEQPELQTGGWALEWEDLCSVEVERWNVR